MKPPIEDWRLFDAYKDAGNSATKAAIATGASAEAVKAAHRRCDEWLDASGWRDAFVSGIRYGMPLVDARERADQVAAIYDREKAS